MIEKKTDSWLRNECITIINIHIVILTSLLNYYDAELELADRENYDKSNVNAFYHNYCIYCLVYSYILATIGQFIINYPIYCDYYYFFK